MELCNLKTLSPVHIGSGRYLMRNNEFICNKENIGIVDDKKVLEIIGEENIGQWLSIINKDESVWDLLTRRNPGLKLSEVSKRYYYNYAYRTEGFHLKEQLINGMGQPYIPGSSLKGAIRSAVFDYLLRQNLKRIEKSDISFVRHDNKEKVSAKNLEEKLFGRDPNSDFFRFLLIGDAIFKPDSLAGLGVESLNIKKDDVISDESKYLLTEAIDKDKNTTFRFKINYDLLEKNIRLAGMNRNNTKTLNTISGLFKIINDHTLMLLEQEKNFWEEYDQHKDAIEYITSINEMYDETDKSKENECVLRVGYGSGWLFITGGWAYEKNLVSDELFNLIVNHSRPQNPKYEEFPFPKSRRMTINYELFGFVKLSV